ncbi:GNAT family N-acetyltransferase [Candidatus Latescibacterota bacterium]
MNLATEGDDPVELRETKVDEGWRVEILSDGRSVSGLWVIDRSLRIGSAVVTVGGIGGVETDREHRRRGLARRSLEAAVDLMGREGYEASFLFGIQDFYHRFGFATCMADHELVIGTRAAERAERRLKLRRLRRADLPAVVRIYNRDNAARTASCVRTSRWRGFERGTSWGVGAAPHVAVGESGRVVGYICLDGTEERCRASEVGGTGDDVFHTLLAALARRAVSLRREEISLSVPGDHPFALFCRQFGARATSQFVRRGGPMGRIIDLESFLCKLLPVLGERWQGAAPELVLATDLGTCVLRRGRGGELVLAARPTRGALRLRLNQDVLMQLACGYRSVEACWLAGDLSGTVASRDLAGRLFPLHQGHMWWSDRF